MADRILFVDDDKNVLAGFRRMLHDDYDVAIAENADEALNQLDLRQPFSVVVCDLRMPGLDGIETLRRITRKSPDTVRVMLTGNADHDAARRAINEGNVFRYLSKPCAEPALREVLDTAVKHYNVVIAEKTLIEKTLMGCVRTLTDLLSISQPEAFSRAARARKWVRPMVKSLNERNIGDEALTRPRLVWEIQLAAILWPIGLMSVPPQVIGRAENAPDTLSSVEREMLARAPETAHQLLANIPRIENVAAMVLYQDRTFDGAGFPENGPVGMSIPEGARILKVLKAIAAAGPDDTPSSEMVATLRENATSYDPAVLATAQLLWGKKSEQDKPRRIQYSLSVGALVPGDHLIRDIVSDTGRLLLGEGQQINVAQLERLRNLARLQKVAEPILIEREI